MKLQEYFLYAKKFVSFNKLLNKLVILVFFLYNVNYLAVNGTVPSLPVLIQNILNCVLKMNKAFMGLDYMGVSD